MTQGRSAYLKDGAEEGGVTWLFKVRPLDNNWIEEASINIAQSLNVPFKAMLLGFARGRWNS